MDTDALNLDVPYSSFLLPIPLFGIQNLIENLFRQILFPDVVQNAAVTNAAQKILVDHRTETLYYKISHRLPGLFRRV